MAGCFNALFARADVYLGSHSLPGTQLNKDTRIYIRSQPLAVGLSGQKSFGQAKRRNRNVVVTGEMEMEPPNLVDQKGDYQTNCPANVTHSKRNGVMQV